MKLALKSILGVFCLWFTTTVSAQIPEKAEDISPLLIGEILPEASLQDPDGNQLSLQKIISSQPSVLVFYRGGWCPYCNVHLSGLVAIEKEILDAGFQILAISPDDFQNLKSTEEDNSIGYRLFSDPQGQFIKDIGIAFQTPSMMKGFIASKGQIGEISEVMPVPTVMVVDQEGKILFEYINPDYKVRISGEMLLAVLKTLQ